MAAVIFVFNRDVSHLVSGRINTFDEYPRVAKAIRLCYSFFVNRLAEPSESREIDGHRWNLLQRKAQEANVARAFSIFLQNGIEPILIKGFAAQRNYPTSHPRVSADMDLAVSPAAFEESVKVSRSASADGLAIDLHSGLRHLDTVGWDDLFANSITVDIDDVPVRILRPEDHLRVLCVHWLTDGGAFKERLWDIYYAVDGRPDGFDWHRCLDVVSQNRRRWIICVIGLTSRYLELKIDDLPFADEARDLPAWLARSVEKEWASDVRLTPIHIYLRDPVNLLKQIKKRLPPNPIQATIEMEGSFDAGTRIHYQFASFFTRIGPSVKRILSAMVKRNN